MRRMIPALIGAILLVSLPAAARAQAGATAREAIREQRREARRAAAEERDGQPAPRPGAAAERLRVEEQLRQALGRAVRQRLNLNDDQATRLMDVNRRFGDDRLRIARNEMQIRRELRASIQGGDSVRSPNTARLLDQLMDMQRQRLDVQQKEQTALSEFLSPEQRARYIAMMEQLRRRIQARADSLRGAGDPPEE